MLVLVSTQALADDSVAHNAEIAGAWDTQSRIGAPATNPGQHVLVTAAVPIYTQAPDGSGGFIYTPLDDPSTWDGSTQLYTNDGTDAAPNYQAATGNPGIDTFRTKTMTETVDEGMAASAANAQDIGDNEQAITAIEDDIRDTIKPDIDANAQGVADNAQEIIDSNDAQDVALTQEINNANTVQDGIRDTARDAAITGANDAQNTARDASRTQEIGDANTAQDIVRDGARTKEIDASNTVQDGIRDTSRKVANDAQDVIISGNTEGIARNARGIADNAGDIADNEGGVAMAIALAGVDFVGGESFGVALNVGTFKDSTALGLSLAGVLGEGIFGEGDRLTVSGGAAFAVDGGGSEDFAGRVGMQLTW